MLKDTCDRGSAFTLVAKLNDVIRAENIMKNNVLVRATTECEPQKKPLRRAAARMWKLMESINLTKQYVEAEYQGAQRVIFRTKQGMSEPWLKPHRIGVFEASKNRWELVDATWGLLNTNGLTRLVATDRLNSSD